MLACCNSLTLVKLVIIFQIFVYMNFDFSFVLFRLRLTKIFLID